MEIRSKIVELIDFLDPKNDQILIIALQSKLIDMENDYKSRYNVTDLEISHSLRGLHRTIKCWIEADCRMNPRYVKLEKIENNRDCKYCENNTEKGLGDYGFADWDNPVCVSCIKWNKVILDEKEKIELVEAKKYDVEIPRDVIELKALINKIKNKLDEIKYANK